MFLGIIYKTDRIKVILRMSRFREAREALLYAYSENMINEEEFVPKIEILNTGYIQVLS